MFNGAVASALSARSECLAQGWLGPSVTGPCGVVVGPYICWLRRRWAMPWFGRRTNLLPQARVGRRTSSSLPVGSADLIIALTALLRTAVRLWGSRAPDNPLRAVRQPWPRKKDRERKPAALSVWRSAGSATRPASPFQLPAVDGRSEEQHGGPAHQGSLDVVGYLSPPFPRPGEYWGQALARHLRDSRCGSSVLVLATSSRELGTACRPHWSASGR